VAQSWTAAPGGLAPYMNMKPFHDPGPSISVLSLAKYFVNCWITIGVKMTFRNRRTKIQIAFLPWNFSILPTALHPMRKKDGNAKDAAIVLAVDAIYGEYRLTGPTMMFKINPTKLIKRTGFINTFLTVGHTTSVHFASGRFSRSFSTSSKRKPGTAQVKRDIP
jgi:hypothetical protein